MSRALDKVWQSWGSKALGIRSCTSVAQTIVSAFVIRSCWAKVL
jgi:hypothetical protein